MRKLSGKLFSHVVAAAAAATCIACATGTAPAARVDHSALRTVLKETLAKDARLATATKVDINSTTGIVTLSGRVESKEEREIAGRLACSVKGVSVVYNEIEVGRTAR